MKCNNVLSAIMTAGCGLTVSGTYMSASLVRCFWRWESSAEFPMLQVKNVFAWTCAATDPAQRLHFTATLRSSQRPRAADSHTATTDARLVNADKSGKSERGIDPSDQHHLALVCIKLLLRLRSDADARRCWVSKMWRNVHAPPLRMPAFSAPIRVLKLLAYPH